MLGNDFTIYTQLLYSSLYSLSTVWIYWHKVNFDKSSIKN